MGLEACTRNYCDIVILLLNAGAEVNVCASNGDTPFLAAACLPDCEIMSLLIDAGANVLVTRPCSVDFSETFNYFDDRSMESEDDEVMDIDNGDNSSISSSKNCNEIR